MALTDLAAWLSAAPLLLGLGLLRRHWARLPALPYDPQLPEPVPTVCLCIPVRDEARELPAALDSWLAQDYPALRILVIDDGSTDGSTELLAARVEARPDRLRVLRNDHLPPGWLGKNHALDLATRQPEARAADWLLFADGDVQAAPDLLRRALAFALAQPTDVLALVPAVDAVSVPERVILPLAASAFLVLIPPHQVPNPRHPAFCGVGGFTLVRRAAYEAVGGHAAAPLEAIDDMMLARRLKAAGHVNRVARGGPDLHLRMYHGLGELIRAMRKNAAALPFWWLLPLLLPLALAVSANQVVHPSCSGKLKAPTNSFQENSDEPPQSSKVLPLQSSPICSTGALGGECCPGLLHGWVQQADRPQVVEAVPDGG